MASAKESSSIATSFEQAAQFARDSIPQVDQPDKEET
jgi:hypothetical protein